MSRFGPLHHPPHPPAAQLWVIHPSIHLEGHLISACLFCSRNVCFFAALLEHSETFSFPSRFSPGLSYFLVICSDPLAGQWYFFKGVLQTFSVAGRSNFWVQVPGNLTVEIMRRKKSCSMTPTEQVQPSYQNL